MEDECPCCCEPYNKGLNTAVKCEHGNCEYICCKTCIRTYLLGTTADPHCMKCQKAWSDEFFVKNLNKSFTNNEYKDHRKKLLTEREITKLPETMTEAKNFETIEKLNEANKELRDKQKILKEEINKLQEEIYQNSRVIANVNTKNPVQKAKFTLPCGAEGCRGFLSTAYKCELCGFYSCPKCLVVIGDKRVNENHVCDPNLVATTELIKNTTKPCPKCGERIQKTDGCDQMWCIECQTAFSWTTGLVDNGVVHNPHYYQWHRDNNNGVVPRNPGDNCCNDDRMPHFYEIHRVLNGFKEYSDPVKWAISKSEIRSLHQVISHIRWHEFASIRRQLRTNSDYKNERIYYLLNRIDKDEMMKKIIKKDKQRRKLVSLSHIVELLVNAGTDLFKNLEDHFVNSLLGKLRNASLKKKKKEVAEEAYEFLTDIVNQFNNLLKYFNKEAKKISVTYGHKVLTISKRTTNFTGRLARNELPTDIDPVGVKFTNFYTVTRKFNQNDLMESDA